MQLIAVAAMTKDGCIGKNGTIPWHYKEDFQYFKKLTLDSTVVMGRKTWNSLPKRPLPKRNNVILTRTPPADQSIFENTYFVENENKLGETLTKLREPHYVIGGEQIFRLLWSKIHICCITIVKDEVVGDTYFPKQLFTEFKVQNSFDLSENCTVYKYVREK